jgi:hypothetical protein
MITVTTSNSISAPTACLALKRTHMARKNTTHTHIYTQTLQATNHSARFFLSYCFIAWASCAVPHQQCTNTHICLVHVWASEVDVLAPHVPMADPLVMEIREGICQLLQPGYGKVRGRTKSDTCFILPAWDRIVRSHTKGCICFKFVRIEHGRVHALRFIQSPTWNHILTWTT